MGKEQGDEMPADPPVYVRTVNGAEQERTALTKADEVNLKAEGWQRKASEKRGGSRSNGGGKSTGGQGAATGSERSNA